MMPDPAQLRGVELFAALTGDQIAWLASQGTVQELADGTVLFEDGQEGRYFYVLLAGELLITKLIDGREHVMSRHVAHPCPGSGPDGKPSAASQYTGELPMLAGGPYVARATAVGRTELIVYDQPTFLGILARCPQVCRVLLPVLAWRIRSYERESGRSALLEGLGTLAAGLAHELNNPASAVVRAARDLITVTGCLADAAIRWGGRPAAERAAWPRFTTLAGPADPLATADIADEIEQVLARHGVGEPGELASMLAEAGVEPGGLSVPGLPDAAYQAAVPFLAYSLQARALAQEAAEAGSRIETLVGAAQAYTNVGRAPRQDVRLAEGLDATLVMLTQKLSGIQVHREYAELPPVPGYPSELNQVWTHLIDNAVDAMNGCGQLRLRTAREGSCAIVEIADTGPGIPPAVLPQLFEPFFTTKDIGKGTGLGLHLTRGIIVHRHNGDIDVTSVPGGTCFRVRIPL